MTSPGPVVNILDDSARETFATGRPLEDSPDLQVCKHCKKSILKTAARLHVQACLKAKREKLQKKKEAKEARDREKKGLPSKDVEGEDGKGGSDDDDDDEKGPGGFKGGKKSAGKNNGDAKGKKRKADGEGEKGPKQKKKKEEPKPKAPKPKGEFVFLTESWVTYLSYSMGMKKKSGMIEYVEDLVVTLLGLTIRSKQIWFADILTFDIYFFISRLLSFISRFLFHYIRVSSFLPKYSIIYHSWISKDQ